MKPTAPPPAEKTRLDLGYVRLTDSAPLIVAAELGLFDRHGLSVTLHQEVSWANVRDKLTVGALDAAQILAPLPAMTTLGVSGIRVPMMYALTLSRNGNTITLAEPLWRQVHAGGGGGNRAADTARSLAAVIDRTGAPTFAVVHPFSTHAILLRSWLRAGGVDPDRDVRTIVVPPAQMVDSLANGLIDGFCAGEPWGSVAVRHGVGAIAALGSDVWNDSPEKVLGVTERWHAAHPATHLRLRLALMEACAWLAEATHRPQTAEILSAPRYLDLPAEWLLPSLTGRMRLEPDGDEIALGDVHGFGAGAAGCPRRSEARALILRGLDVLGRRPDGDALDALARETCRPDLFRDAAAHLGIPFPGEDDRDTNGCPGDAPPAQAPDPRS